MRYEMFSQAITTKSIVEFMYKYIDDSNSQPCWRQSKVIPITFKHGRKGTHILAWDVDQDNWRRFAIINTKNIEQVTERYIPTNKYMKTFGAVI